MPYFVALLRAVNVGGTGKLAMRDLAALCEAAGFLTVRTYTASGNVMFSTAMEEAEIKAILEARLKATTGAGIGVLVRTAAELAEVLVANPFPNAPGNRVVAIFLDEPAPSTALAGVTGQQPNEEIQLGRREIYVRYGDGMARTTLRIPAARTGTARNMNTIAKLVSMTRP